MSRSRINIKDIITICIIPIILLSINIGIHTFFYAIVIPDYSSNRFYSGLISCLTYTIAIGLFLPLYIMRRWDYKANIPIPSKLTKNSLKKPYSASSSLLIIILPILGVSLQIGVTAILQLITYTDADALADYNNMIQNSFVSSLGILNTFSVAFLAPIAEELAFRGFGMSIAAKLFYKPDNMTHIKNSISKNNSHTAKPYILCILIISLLFGLYHGNITQILYAIPMGIILGYLTVIFSTIIPSVILHITINTSAYLLPDSLYNTKEMTIITLIISLFFAAASIFTIHILFVSKKASRSR